ncbi:Choline/ethanolamine kinase, partial [Cooperia oncophora]
LFQNYFKSHDELDLRTKILSLCSDVLGGGGLTNLVYLVSRSKFSSSDDQPSTVLLRIQSQTDHEKLLNELVVFTSLAESGLGPKLLGIFPGGRFEEYIPSRPVDHHEVADPRVCTLLARLLPRFHSTAVPISKRPSLVHMMREWLALYEDQGNSHIQMRTTSFQLPPDT